MTELADALPEELVQLAQALLAASKSSPISDIKSLLDKDAPAWYQDEELGWSCLHYAAERRESEVLRLLLSRGAVWNAVDLWGRTAGEICLSLGDRSGWEVIRNEGIRSEMLHHAMGDAAAAAAASSSTTSVNGSHVKLRAEDKTSAGDNDVFLKSKLTWEKGEDGKERVLDADGNGVMMGWEEPLMREHSRLMTTGNPHAESGGDGASILNIGYGLGIVDKLFQASASSSRPRPRSHVIIEAHPDVLRYMKETGVYDWPNVKILEGRWQEFVGEEKLGELLELAGEGFDAIFMDTFAEGYEELKAFFEVIPDILEPQHGVFSFWNGLGATNPTIYAVSASLAELHMEDVGLDVEWHDVAIPESQREETWKGIKRRYWDLPGYRLPIARMRS